MNKEEEVVEIQGQEVAKDKDESYSINILAFIKMLLAELDREELPIINRFSFVRMGTLASLYLGVVDHINTTFNTAALGVHVNNGYIIGTRDKLRKALSCIADEYILDKTDLGAMASIFIEEMKQADSKEEFQELLAEIQELETRIDSECFIFSDGVNSNTCTSAEGLDPHDPVACLEDTMHDLLFESLDVIAEHTADLLAEPLTRGVSS